MTEHARFNEDIGAYLLGALDERERRDFERHLRDCETCQEELERLRPAADVLPGSVEQREPPPGLKARLMAEVEGDAARAGRAEGDRARGAEAGFRGRGPVPGFVRRMRVPRLAFAAAAVLLGLAIGFGVAQLGGDDTRTVVATVDPAMPRAGGNLEIEGDSATLRLHDMPDLRGQRVYQVWLQRGDELVPARTFEVGTSGRGEVELRDLGDADGVHVTREARGGANVPSEEPIVSVPL